VIFVWNLIRSFLFLLLYLEDPSLGHPLGASSPTTEPVLWNPRAELQGPYSATREATTMKSPHTETRE